MWLNKTMHMYLLFFLDMASEDQKQLFVYTGVSVTPLKTYLLLLFFIYSFVYLFIYLFFFFATLVS